MKNKLIALMLTLTTVFGVLAGLCFAAKAESPNLLELYGFNSGFADGINPWKSGDANSILEQCDEDSQDEDGYCAKATSRAGKEAVPRLNRLTDILLDQGDGTYYYSFYVKCAKPNSSCTMGPRVSLTWGGAYSKTGVEQGLIIASYLYGQQYGAKLDTFQVTGKEWTKVEMKFDVTLENDGKQLATAALYASQTPFDKSNAPDLLFDNFTLIKQTGDWVEVTPEPKVSVPSQARVDQVQRSEKTGIGAINYFMWQETAEEWWKYTNDYLSAIDENSSQEARCLAPDKYHYRLPFWATLKTDITEEDKKLINGTVTSIPEFPEYTEAIWRQEMEYAVDAGIDFMAYLWTQKGRKQSAAYMYHISTKGMDGKIKMCAILQNETQDLNAMAAAACEDYWYTIDGMPVVFIYGGKDAATEDFISIIRRKIAIAQYVKNGEVGKPAYIVSMNVSTYSTAVGMSSRGLDATSWYGQSVSSVPTQQMTTEWDNNGTLKRVVSIEDLVNKNMSEMQTIKRVASSGYMSVISHATLGNNTEPRIDNPVTWIEASGKSNLPYGGHMTPDFTSQEITQTVLDVLNFNKENAKYFAANTVIMYCWNEFDEGGWFCPTLAVDEQGNALKNANGTNKVNRENLDAVKKAIELYREHEAEAAIYDVDGNKIKDIDMATPTPKPQKTQSPVATQTPEANVDPQDEVNNNGWVLWTIIGGAVVLVAAAAVVVVIVLKKKKAAAAVEKTEE